MICDLGICIYTQRKKNNAAIYIGVDGEIVCDYLNPKKMLDDLRLLYWGKSEPIMELCKQFNRKTDDGRNMGELSALL